MYNKIGFHLGPGGPPHNLDELAEHAYNERFPIVLKVTDDYGRISDYVDLMYSEDRRDIPDVFVFRLTTHGQKDGFDYDVPNYFTTPEAAAEAHVEATLAKLPSNFNKELVWLELINEVDKERSDWLGSFALACWELLRDEGFKLAFPGWSSGEPEPWQWETPGMLEFLRECARFPKKLAVATHEYSYDKDDIWRFREEDGDGGFVHWLVGRLEHLFAVCEAHNIALPTTIITEFGWEYGDAPDPEVGFPMLREVNQFYDQYPNVIGLMLWYLGPNFGDIAAKIVPYIDYIVDYSLALGYDQPPSRTCIEFVPYNRTHLLHPRDLTIEQRNKINDWLRDGVPNELLISNRQGKKMIHNAPRVNQRRPVGFAGWTHQDPIEAIRDAVLNGMTNSMLIVVDGDQIGTGLTREWLEEICPVIVPHTRWISTTEQPSYVDPLPTLRLRWPVTTPAVTVPGGEFDAPREYNGVPYPHEGVDFAPTVTPSYAVAVYPYSVVRRKGYNPGGWGNFVELEAVHEGVTFRYIHAHLAHFSNIEVGDILDVGEVVGKVGTTGNSSGVHDHFTLTAPGLGMDGYVIADVVDPTGKFDPYQQPISNEVKLGLHARADGGDISDAEVKEFELLRPEVIKILSSHSEATVRKLMVRFPNASWIIRAFLTFRQGDGSLRIISPEQFVNDTLPDIRRAMTVLQGKDVWIEVHNEPNLTLEGMGEGNWTNGLDFADWCNQVIAQYRIAIPNVKCLYPGLSPGGTLNIRRDSLTFLQESLSAGVKLWNGYAFHAYWGGAGYSVPDAVLQLRTHLNHIGSQAPVWLTEVSNNQGGTDERLGWEYADFISYMKDIPNVEGVTFFVASASDSNFQDEVWVSESGQSKGIALRLRQLVPTT